MAQHDYVIANGTGAAVRSDLNNALAAIVSQNSGATAPSTTYAYQWWADTTTGLLKLRNAANNAWITLFQLDGEWSTLAVENGSAAAPSIYFKDSGTDTGIYSPGTDQVAISTGGTGRLFVDSSGRVGLGTPTPGSILTAKGPIASTSDWGNLGITSEFAVNSSNRIYNGFYFLDSGTSGSAGIGFSYDGTGYKLHIGTASTTSSGISTALTVDRSQRVGIGTATPQAKLHVNTGTNENLWVMPSALSAGGVQVGSIVDAANAYANLTINGTNLLFGNGSAERARIDSSGRLLVGTSTGTSTAKFLVEGNTSDGLAGILDLQYGGTSPADGTNIGGLRFKDRTSDTFYASIQCNADGGTSATDKNGRLVFSTTADGASSPTERMRIHNNGDITIAKTARDYTTAGAWIQSTGTINSAASGLDFWNAYNTAAGAYRFWVSSAGTINATSTTISAISDIRFKENIADIDRGLAEILALKPRKFDWKDGKGRDIKNDRGFIAQEFEMVFPDLIDQWKDPAPEGEEPYKSVRQDLIPVLVKAIQEQQAMIIELQTKVAALEAP